MSPPLIHPEINRLARRIHAGEVVFFVGAGFSIDSEGLSAKRIVRRLLIRLYALEAVFAPAAEMTAAFAGVFGEDYDWKRNLKIPTKISEYDDPAVGRLASRYYEVNEWLIQAYSALLPAQAPDAGRDLSGELNRKEAEVARAAGPEWEKERFRQVPASYWPLLGGESGGPRQKLGKLIFLDAVGFLDEMLMAGCLESEIGTVDRKAGDGRASSSSPDAAWSDLVATGRSYRDNFRTRHHVLARLAREGLCTTLVTTNFDLLLEGAFRLAGFCWPHQPVDLAPTSAPHFDVIDSAASFYTKGKAFRTATVVKLHGCARRVRNLEKNFRGATDARRPEDALQVRAFEAKIEASRRKLEDYLDEVVFTYREIQNWRDDSWAADFVRTLLRTRTVVFSGYSTADPVIHDTVRSVYEEMAREHAKVPKQRGTQRVAEHRPWRAPAYFLAYNSDDDAEKRQEFHGREILRAASLAVGAAAPVSTGEHPNYIRFRKPTLDARRLPVDELLRWTHHLVFRRQQMRALRSDLRSLMKVLLNRVSVDDLYAVQVRFWRRVLRELRMARGRGLPDDPRVRRTVLRGALDWSSGFHRALLREWACGQALQRTASLTRNLQHMTHPLWYYPASERPAWTAWTAVLELALERLAVLAQASWTTGAAPTPAHALYAPILTPMQAPQPTVLIRRGPEIHAPQLALSLRMRGLDSPNTLPEVPGHAARHVVWTLAFDSLPWIGESGCNSHSTLNLANARWTPAPPANVIWKLALGRDDFDLVDLNNYLIPWAPPLNS